MRIKGILFFAVFFMVIFSLFAEKMVSFSNIFNPKMLFVDENKLYIADQYSVFIFSTVDYKLLYQLGRKGEGPGEFLSTPGFQVLKDRILLYDREKIVFFSKDGKIIEEKRFHRSYFLDIAFLGKNFIAMNMEMDEKNRSGFDINLYNQDFKKIKILNEGEKINLFSRKKKKNPLIGPLIDFKLMDNRIYIVDGRKGFHIEVYSDKGIKLVEIKKDIKKIKPNDIHKERRYKEIQYIPVVRRRGLDYIKKNTYFPEYLPEILDFFVSDGRLYVKTYVIKEAKEEFKVLDTKGNLIKTIYLPQSQKRLFAFYKNSFFYLKENEEEEEWELYREAFNLKGE
jgi:hypothetical protein